MKQNNVKYTNYIYPVIVEKTDTGVSIYFPDIHGIAVTAPNIQTGIKDAKVMLAHRLVELEEEGEVLPNPSDYTAIELLNPSDRIVYLDVYLPPYRVEAANKSVTKNCTMPKWLRDAGEEAGLNFSLILQNAVKESLNIKE